MPETNENNNLGSFKISFYGLGIEENLNFGGFSVLPNPSLGIFTITSNGKCLEDVEIFNDIGENIYSQKLISDKTEIDLSTVSKGIYFIKIIAEDKTYSQKIIIQ